jgi:hypothetical protein
LAPFPLHRARPCAFRRLDAEQRCRLHCALVLAAALLKGLSALSLPVGAFASDARGGSHYACVGRRSACTGTPVLTRSRCARAHACGRHGRSGVGIAPQHTPSGQ